MENFNSNQILKHKVFLNSRHDRIFSYELPYKQIYQTFLIRKLWAVDHPVQRKKIFTKPVWFSRPLERCFLKKEPFNF